MTPRHAARPGDAGYYDPDDNGQDYIADLYDDFEPTDEEAHHNDAIQGYTANGVAGPKVNRYRDALILGADIKNLPPPTPLIPGFLDRDSIAALYGPSGGCKTFVAIDWAMKLVTNVWDVDGEYTQPGRVLYALAEGAAGIGTRIDAWEQHHARSISDALVWLNLPLGLYQATPDVMQDLIEVAVDMRPDLIFVDTLAKNAVGAEENSNRDMGIVVERLEELRRATGATTCAIHHTGHDGGHMRGASALLGNVDTVIKCEGAEGRVTLTVEKQRNHEGGQKTYLRTVQSGESLVLVEAEQVFEEDGLLPSDERALEALAEIMVGGGIPTTTWRDATEQPKSTFYRSSARLVRFGFVTNIGTDKQARYIIATTGAETRLIVGEWPSVE